MSKLLLTLFIMISISRIFGLECICDYDSSGRKLSKRNTRIVNFQTAQLVGENYKRPYGTSSLHNTELYLTNDNSCQSEQVHITLGSETNNEVIISYTNKNITALSRVEYSINKDDLMNGSTFHTAIGKSFSYSANKWIARRLYKPSMGKAFKTEAEILAMQNTYEWAKDPITGEHYSSYYNYTSVQLYLGRDDNPQMIYDSPMIFEVSLQDLIPGETYYYRVSGSCEIFEFVYPRVPGSLSHSIYPFKVGLTADLGQTEVSSASIDALKSMEPDVVLLSGDLSYADGWPELWDTFGRLIQSLAAFVPLLTTGGNHEISSSEAWQSYQARYPTPHYSSGSPNFCYWGREVGVMNVISLCSYAGYNSTSLQYQWLSNYLASRINRRLTPWIIVIMHAPWYNTNNGHWKEGEVMRLSMEPLLYEYGVDLVIAGHVHSYERTTPVYNSISNICGATYINIGDGGNYENAYTDWRFPADSWSVFREGN